MSRQQFPFSGRDRLKLRLQFLYCLVCVKRPGCGISRAVVSKDSFAPFVWKSDFHLTFPSGQPDAEPKCLSKHHLVLFCCIHPQHLDAVLFMHTLALPSQPCSSFVTYSSYVTCTRALSPVLSAVPVPQTEPGHAGPGPHWCSLWVCSVSNALCTQFFAFSFTLRLKTWKQHVSPPEADCDLSDSG